MREGGRDALLCCLWAGYQEWRRNELILNVSLGWRRLAASALAHRPTENDNPQRIQYQIQSNTFEFDFFFSQLDNFATGFTTMPDSHALRLFAQQHRLVRKLCMVNLPRGTRANAAPLLTHPRASQRGTGQRHFGDGLH